ncbi:hypothetical protein GIY30_23430 [Gordonia sp. HNM0687]|uniref:Uncharacterized protein n=1 Tax=Gordonia mangrovi TaxID=2665643 RepID=A0A6L7GWA5_9ACTN|nr:hypothetical protein [Gordonia mangrovi]MXP24279.1 hypothetical protein [Gordonia mangrovi]UVF79902.1 hypothetical protein NWF22_08810 [Gordonia mangrovi]
MKPTHIQEFSDGRRVTMGPDTLPRFLKTPLTVLDGGDRNHLILSRLVRQEWFDDLSEQERDESLSAFLQAGGSAEAMTLELRRKESDGSYRQYTLGRGEGSESGSTVEIKVGDHTYRVTPDEVFTAEDAGEVFVHYFRHGDVPAGLSLRELVR